MAGRACPSCGTLRKGSFRYCLSCGFDYEAAGSGVVTRTTAPSPAAPSADPTSAPVMPPFATPPLAPTPSAVPPAAIRAKPAATTRTRQEAPSGRAVEGTSGPPALAGGASRASLARGKGPLLTAVAGVAVVLFAFAVIGLRGGSPASTAASPEPSARSSGAVALPSGSVGPGCVDALRPYVATLTELRSKVSTGMELAEYATLIDAATKAREELKPKGLSPACVAVLGRAQVVLTDQTLAYNSWRDCTKTTGCSLASIQAQLEQRWSAAAADLDEVTRAIR